MRRSLTRLLLLGALLASFFPGQSMFAHGSSSFSSPQVLQFLPGRDEYPSALQARNGSLWVVWQHSPYRIYLRTYNGTFWSTPQDLAIGTRYNFAPSLSQLQNGTLILFWSSNQTGHWNFYYETFSGSVWTKAVQLTSGPFDDFFASAVLGPDSVLWIFWERVTSGSQELYYKTLNGTQRSADTQLTFDPTWNVTPAATVTIDGTIWVTWSRLDSKNGNYNLFYRTFNGIRWSGDTQFTNSLTVDLEPSIVQDRNGTLWLFWSREMLLKSGTNLLYQQKLFCKNSYDGGKTWSADTQLTFAGDATNPIDDLEPSAVQGIDRGIWVFFSSDLTGFGSDFDIYYIKTNPISPVHAVAVTSLRVSPVRIFPWYDVSITVTIADLGDFNENASLTVLVEAGVILNISTISAFLTPGGFKTFTLNWNASSAPPGRYLVLGSLASVPGETIGSSLGNTFKFSTLNIYYPGDLDRDGRVDTLDASILLASYGSKPTDPMWNPDADLNRDGVINIIDLGMWASNLGRAI